MKDGGDGIGEGWLIHIRVWVGGGGKGVGITSKFFFVFFLFVPLSFGLSYPVSF